MSNTCDRYRSLSLNQGSQVGHVASEQINHCAIAGRDSCPITVMGEMNALLLPGT